MEGRSRRAGLESLLASKETGAVKVKSMQGAELEGRSPSTKRNG